MNEIISKIIANIKVIQNIISLQSMFVIFIFVNKLEFILFVFRISKYFYSYFFLEIYG